MSEPGPPPLFRHARRLEAFSDGVFAIAVTLLILEIKVPSAEDTSTPALLWAALLTRWPSYFAFLLSFGTILVAWVGPHLLMQQVRRVTARLVLANGLHLLTITFLPFPTALVAEHLRQPSGSVAAAVYAGVAALNSLTFLLLFLAVRASGLEKSAVLEITPYFDKARFGVVACVAAAVLAFWSPPLSLLVVAAVWAWCAVPSPVKRRENEG